MKPSHTGALAAVTMHMVALAGVMSYAPARSALLESAPIMVDWIAAPKVEPKVEPPARLPKPKPVTRTPPAVPAPILAAAPEAPPIVTPAPPPPPPEPVALAPAAVPAPAPVAAPVPVTPPIFNANYLDNPAPVYPVMSRRLGEQGRVVLRVLVNPGGKAEEVQIRTSSGSTRLDDSALETVRQWKFIPAKQGPQPISAWVLIPISFRLEG
jgi:periplasmic protein TonB